MLLIAVNTREKVSLRLCVAGKIQSNAITLKLQKQWHGCFIALNANLPNNHAQDPYFSFMFMQAMLKYFMLYIWKGTAVCQYVALKTNEMNDDRERGWVRRSDKQREVNVQCVSVDSVSVAVVLWEKIPACSQIGLSGQSVCRNTEGALLALSVCLCSLRFKYACSFLQPGLMYLDLFLFLELHSNKVLAHCC